MIKPKQFRDLAAHEVINLGFDGFYDYMVKKQRHRLSLDQLKDKYNLYVEVYGIFESI